MVHVKNAPLMLDNLLDLSEPYDSKSLLSLSFHFFHFNSYVARIGGGFSDSRANEFDYLV